MSYIRCLGNPEGLYIIATLEDQAQIMGAEDAGILSLPRQTFERLLIRWYQDGRSEDSYAYRGARIAVSPTFSHWTLTYKDWPEDQFVTAWEVTWAYIAENVVDRYRPRRRLAVRRPVPKWRVKVRHAPGVCGCGGLCDSNHPCPMQDGARGRLVLSWVHRETGREKVRSEYPADDVGIRELIEEVESE